MLSLWFNVTVKSEPSNVLKHGNLTQVQTVSDLLKRWPRCPLSIQFFQDAKPRTGEVCNHFSFNVDRLSAMWAFKTQAFSP